MMRFLAKIARPGCRAETLASPPGFGSWIALRATPRYSLWITDQGASALGAARLQDGAIVGFSSVDGRVADVHLGWGAYVTLAEGVNEIRIYRDPSGRVPAYYARSEQVHLVCSHVDDLTHLPWEGAELDWSYLSGFLQGHESPGRRTGFAGVKEVLPGEEVRMSGDLVTTRLLWSPRDHYRRPIADAEVAAARFRTAAERVVSGWASRYRDVTLDLSGGLDSSAVLGLLATTPTPPRVTAINAGVGHGESDEVEFARAAAALHSTPLVDLDLQNVLPDYGRRTSPALQPRPTTRLLDVGLGAPATAIARSVGATAYFTGRGGDHIFFNSVPAAAALDRLQSSLNPCGWLATS
jgi:asparagine synthase (glutamine-hydrolysing)